ncbi:MAG: hypothetical protein V4773_16060 [Verrucomicrobiota bacterium]
MLRRVFALILALTCAFAPGLAAFELGAAPAADCCCGTKCPCPPTDCAPPPAMPVSAKPASNASVEERVATAKPSARVVTAAFAHFLSARSVEPALGLRAASAHAARPAGSVALFQAHCSLLL